MTTTNLRLSKLTLALQGTSFRYRAKSRPPLFLMASAITIAFLAMLPLSYLIVRATGAGYEKVWDILLRARTHQIFFNSAALALAVVLATVVIGVALAWLTVRTDLPGRLLLAKDCVQSGLLFVAQI